MELKIFWTDFAKIQLRNIYDYYRENASVRIAKKLVQEIARHTLILKNQPKMGQIEELLLERKEEFRYLVYRNYKIIYWINLSEKRIEISDVFDCHQNPKKIKRNLESV